MDITLPKLGKDPILGNYRPISLLSKDVNIYTKIIALRLMRALPDIINPNQVGFISGLQAPDATRSVIELVQRSELCQTPSTLLGLDAERPFDRVHWGYMGAVLVKFGFKGWILSAIMSLYSSTTAWVLVTGIMSKLFIIENGTKQGFPLSPFVFALVMCIALGNISKYNTIFPAYFARISYYFSSKTRKCKPE